MKTSTFLTGAAFAATLLASQAARADITIGLVAPLTGPVAAYGDQVKNGAQTAVDVINKAGGVLGEKLVLKLADDAGDPKQGVSSANLLVGDKVKFVVGPVTSGVAMAVSDVLAESGVLMVTPTATSPALTTRGLTNVFRTCGRDDQQADIAATYALKNLKDKKIAIVHDKGTYGKGLADAFQKGINAGGLKEVAALTVNPGDKDLSAVVTRLKAANVEVIYFGGYHPEGGLLARQLADAGVKAVIIGGEGLSNTEFAAIGGDHATGTLFTNATDALKNPDSAQARLRAEGEGHPAGSLHAQRLCRGRGAQGRDREGRQAGRRQRRRQGPAVRHAGQDRDRHADLRQDRRPELAELLDVQVGRRQDRRRRMIG